MKRQKRRNTLADKKTRKSGQAYIDGGGNSKYARKRYYCRKHGVWGWEVPFPKPWNKRIQTAA